jgi:hypothetical protein
MSSSKFTIKDANITSGFTMMPLEASKLVPVEIYDLVLARAERAEARIASLMTGADRYWEGRWREWEGRWREANAKIAELENANTEITTEALREHRVLRARAERAEAALEEWEQCARYDAMMEGPRFKGWDRSAMERCRKRMEKRRAALGKEDRA